MKFLFKNDLRVIVEDGAFTVYPLLEIKTLVVSLIRASSIFKML